MGNGVVVSSKAMGSRWTIEFDGFTVRMTETEGRKPRSADFSLWRVRDVDVNVPAHSWTRLGISYGMPTFSLILDTGRPTVRLYPSSGVVPFDPQDQAAFHTIGAAIRDACREVPAIRSRATRLLGPGAVPVPTTEATPGTVTVAGFSIGEVSSHFDQQAAGMIAGTMSHDLSVHGGSIGLSTQRLSLTVARIGVSGESRVELATRSTSRTDFMNEGFSARFESPATDGRVQTVRVVVPPEDVCTAQAAEMLAEILAACGFPETEIRHMVHRAIAVSPVEITYAVDQLKAALRPNRQTRFDIVGVPAGRGILLGGAIRAAGGERWVQLFPMGLIRTIYPPAAAASAPVFVPDLMLGATDHAADPLEAGLALAGQGPVMKTCPMCAEDVKAAALICRFCRYEFPPQSAD
jgi:hypothetical protein